MRTATTYYRPTNGEETIGLLAETFDALRQDARVVDNDGLPLADIEAAEKRYASLIPAQHEVDWGMRIDAGWTRDEILIVNGLLTRACVRLLALQSTTPLSGTRATLERDAARYDALRLRWWALLSEDGSNVGG